MRWDVGTPGELRSGSWERLIVDIFFRLAGRLRGQVYPIHKINCI